MAIKLTSNDNQEFIIDGLLPEEEINIFFRAINENGCLSLIQTVSCQSLPCEGNVPVIEDIIINQPLCDDVMTVPVEIIATDEDMPLTYRINLNGSFTIENTTGIFGPNSSRNLDCKSN